MTFTSYNCRGLGINRVYDDCVDEDVTKYDFISALLSKSDFCLIQEHWLSVEEFSSIVKMKLSNVECIVTSPMDDSEQHMGHRKGGTAILYNSNQDAKVERVQSECDRLTVVSVTINTFEFLLFSVYMPCDEQRAGANLNEFIDVLNEIHSICLNSECQFFCYRWRFEL